MIEVYGKPNCSQCVIIKKKLDELGVTYDYINDDKTTTEKAIELHKNKKLVERTAPLIIKDGMQIKHKDIKTIL